MPLMTTKILVKDITTTYDNSNDIIVTSATGVALKHHRMLDMPQGHPKGGTLSVQKGITLSWQLFFSPQTN